MIKKKNAAIFIWFFSALGLNAQTLTIEECYEKARENFPLVKQYALIEKSKEFSLSNAQKAYLPQFGVFGQATYQSEVTQIPIDFSQVPLPALADIKMPKVSKDQYKLYGEVSQSLTDLFTTKSQSNLVKANSRVESQKIEVELYKLRERINSLFFGILLLDAQTEQLELVKSDIQSGIDKLETAIANGAALKSAADNLKAELLKTRQNTAEIRAARKGYADMLALFIGEDISESTMLEKPLLPMLSSEINRPEMQLFDLQNRAINIQNSLITAKNLPRISLFVQGGFGRPALNMLSNNFDPYYVAGVRLSWNLNGFFTFNNEKRQLQISQSSVNVQKETFLFNTNIALRQQNSEIAKMQELLGADEEIIVLRENVKKTTQTQLEYGTATTNDYLLAVNAESQARQNKILHEIQLLLAKLNLKTNLGN